MRGSKRFADNDKRAIRMVVSFEGLSKWVSPDPRVSYDLKTESCRMPAGMNGILKLGVNLCLGKCLLWFQWKLAALCHWRDLLFSPVDGKF